MENQRLEQQIRFLLEIDKLKHVVRQTYLLGTERKENSAEHSWHVAMMAMLLAEYAEQPVDVTRVIKMLLVHDIVEVDAGDSYCYDEVAAVDKAAREQQAADRLFGLLPQDQAKTLRSLWDEYEAGVTPEARFALVLDRLMPLLHNFHTEGKSWQEHGIASAQVLARNEATRDDAGELWELVRSLVDEAVARGLLAG